MYDVISCGSGTVDVFADSESELITRRSVGHTDNLMAFPVGEKLLIKHLNYSVGGGGTNTAVGFARQGYKTGWLGCLGHGTNGELVKKQLKEEGITFLGHTVEKHETGYSFIMNALNHDRTILAYKGANNHLDYDELNLRKIKARCYYFSSMVGQSYATQKKLATHAKDQGALVAFNPSSYQVREGIKKLAPMLKHTDILIFNKEEAEELCQTCDRHHIFTQLHLYDVKIIVITDGGNPFYASHNSQLYKVTPDSVKPLETTGAGDAFACGFVGTYLISKDVSQSLKSGVCNAQSVITHRGAKEKLLTSHALLRKSKSAKIRVTRL